MNSRSWQRVTSKYCPRPYLECSRFVDRDAARSVMSNIIIMVLHLQPTSCVIVRLYVVDCTSSGGACNLDMIAKSQVAHTGLGVAIPLDVVKAWEQVIYTNLAAPKSHPVSAHIVYFILAIQSFYCNSF